jgi:eukaryotic-like serine/threonine-protein kinase
MRKLLITPVWQFVAVVIAFLALIVGIINLYPGIISKLPGNQLIPDTTATATAFRNIYTQATSGTPVLNDPLSGRDNNHWDENLYCTFTGGAYHVTEAQQGSFTTCNAQSTNFFNFTLQVQMVIVKGGIGGILFRSDSTGSNAYIFGIYQDGSYFFTAVHDNNGKSPLYRGTSPAFKTGLNQVNLIAVVARGTNFYLYINGQFVANVSDTSFGSGQIGVFASDKLNPAAVAFSNLKVWQG